MTLYDHMLSRHDETEDDLRALLSDARVNHPRQSDAWLMELIHNRQHTSLDWDAGHHEGDLSIKRNYLGAFMIQDTPRNRRIRNAVFMTSAVVAAGVGCYYGSKRGFKDIAAIAKQMQTSLDIVAIEAGNIVYHLDDEKSYRLNQIKNIDAAVKASVPFQHFPGLGVRFDSIADAEKVDAVLRAVPGVGTKK